MMNIKIDDSRDVVIKDAKVCLSNEKFKSSLSKSYETARKDARKFRLYKYFGIFFSIAISLLITLLTADFKSLGQIPADWVEGIAIAICVGCFVVGFILLVLNGQFRDASIFEERDNAVNKIFEVIKKDESAKD